MDGVLRDQIIAALQKGEPLPLEWADVLISQLKHDSEPHDLGSDIIETINHVGQMLSAELDLQKLVQTVTDATTELVGAEFGAFFYNVVSLAGESYTLYTLSGVPSEKFAKFPMPRNTHVFPPTFHGEGIVRSDDITKDPRYGKNPPYFGKPKGHLPVTSYLAVPVISRAGEVWGGLFFGHSKPGIFTEREEQLIVGLAAQAAIAMDNARLYAEAQRQRQYLEVTLASIGDAVITTDSQGQITFLNHVAEALTGWKTADALGKDLQGVFNIVHERTRQTALNPVERVLKDGVIIGLANHTVLIARDGKERPIDDSAAPIRDGADNVTGAILVFRDVTEQKKAQQIQMQLAAIIKDSDDAIISKDLNGIITSWNRGAEQMYGYSAEEVVGKPISMLIPLDYANDVPHILARIKRGERIGHYETKRQCKDGTILDVSLTISPIYDEEGAVIGASKIARDITEQKRTQTIQEQLVAIIEGSDDAIISKDLNGIITSWNRGAKQMYGYTVEEVVGKPITMLIPPDYPNDVPDILARIKQGEQVVHYETKRMAKDGRVLDVSLTVSPIHDTKGIVIGASKIARNITERKEKELELAQLLERAQQARTEAEQALRSRDEFLSVAAHELRTPVTSLRGFTQLLVQQIDRTGIVPSDRLRIALSHIGEQSQKLNSLVNQLLDVSRIEAGKLTIESMPTNLTSLIQNVITQAQITTQQHNITLQAPHQVQTNIDALRIEQVLTNLIDNAIKYTSGSTIEVAVSTTNSESVNITVTDEGESISPEHHDKIFERFYQAHSASSGMGLGLYISRQIIEMHGGNIHAEFPQEGGTRFVINLPIGSPKKSSTE